MTMNNTFSDAKSLLESKTFWGAVVAIGGTGVSAFTHHALAPSDAAQLVDILSSVVGAVGGVVAIYGRMVATTKIVD